MGRSTRRGFLGALGLGAAAWPSAATPSDPFPSRAFYDLDPDVTYLNHASIGTVPRPVREARRRYDERCERNPWLHVWGGAWDAEVQRAREDVARALAVNPDELALVRTTTEGFNILAGGLSLGADDEVLFSSLNHSGASLPWQGRVASHGYRVRQFDFPVDRARSANTEELVRVHVDALDDSTSVLVLPHVDNVLGIRLPIRAIADAARARGVRWVAVDGAQTAGMIPLDVSALGVDAFATSAHKWFQAPKGTGLLWIRQERIPEVAPLIQTWGQRAAVGTGRKFEDVGTHDHAAWLTLGDAVRFHARLPWERRQAHLKSLWMVARDRVAGSRRLGWRSPEQWDRGASLLAVEVRGADPRDLADRLFRQHGIVVRPFTEPYRALRLSANTMNTAAELHAAFDRIERLIARS